MTTHNEKSLVSDRILNWFMTFVVGVWLLGLTGGIWASTARSNDQMTDVRKEINEGDRKVLDQVLERLDRMDSKWTSILMRKGGE